MLLRKASNFLEFGRRDSRESRASRRFSIVTAMMSLARTRSHGACPLCASKMADVEDEVTLHKKFCNFCNFFTEKKASCMIFVEYVCTAILLFI